MSSGRLIRGRPQSTSRYFWPILTPPVTLCHTSRDPPLKVRHTSRTHPPFLLGLVQKTRTKTPCTNSLLIVCGGFCLEGFVRGGFCPFPFCQNTSVTTES